MKPVLTVEFRARDGELAVEEENVTLNGIDDLRAFVAPGGGCERIPDDVGEIHFTFMPSSVGEHADRLARLPATLQLGMIYLIGPLAALTDALDLLRIEASRGTLSPTFLVVIGAGRERG